MEALLPKSGNNASNGWKQSPYALTVKGLFVVAELTDQVTLRDIFRHP